MQAVVLHSGIREALHNRKIWVRSGPDSGKTRPGGTEMYSRKKEQPLNLQSKVSPAEQADSFLGAGDHYPQPLYLPPASSQNQYLGWKDVKDKQSPGWDQEAVSEDCDSVYELCVAGSR